MKIKRYVLTLIISIIFIPNAKALGSYSVEMVSGTSSNRVIGTYSSYNEAKNVMENQNSNSSETATVYRNNVPVDSKYAIFKFKPNTMIYLYKNSGSTSYYTYLNSSYGSDAAVLGYSENGRVKIMISGFIGWADVNNGVVTPISLLSGNMINVNGGGVRVRKSPSLSSETITNISGSYNFNYTDTRNADGYTWYKITYNGKEAWIAGGNWVTKFDSDLGTYYLNYGPTGNLIHHFQIYSGVTYNDSFTNLGTSPSNLTKDQRYYSFDGNYFYDNIITMLEDYRKGEYKRSVNYNNPYYSYYVYLPSHSKTAYSAEDLDNIVSSKGYNASSSKMYGTGIYFKEAEETYGTNALLAFSTALNESAYGTSSIAMNKNNLFGYGAADNCPYDCAYSYSSPRDSIMSYASNSSASYETASGKYYYGSHYGNKSSGKNIMYASDPYWGEKMAMNAFLKDKNFGGKDFNSNTIGVTKKGSSAPWVFSEPIQDGNKRLYIMKNPNTSDSVYDMSANVIDKVEVNGVSFYKIYTDLPSDKERYGYVWTEEWYVGNNQPEINAIDREVTIGEEFNYMEGITAVDIEDGDLTNRITFEGNVDTSKEGTYKVKYTTFDNNNFHKSKEVNIKVVNDNKITIEAEDKEVTQFTEFNYTENVKAYNNSEDLTSKITYEKTVDTSKVGTYEVTYKVEDTEKTIKVNVIKNELPIINAEDITVTEGGDINPLQNVMATDKEDGDLTDKITYEGKYDTSKIGTYKITYTVQDSAKQMVSKEINLIVKDNSAPAINVIDREVSLNKEINLLEGVTASDEEDGNITDKIIYIGDVDTSKVGTYEIKYTVKDSKGKSTSKTVKISVLEKALEEKEGNFYLEYIKNVDDNLEIKGYNTINGIDNTLNTSISYEVEFENIETGEKTKQKATRITDTKEMPKQVFGLDDKDYTYSWFKLDVDLDKLKDGNYKMYIISSSDDYYSKNLINNKTYKKIDSSYIKEKSVTIRNNYSYEGSPVEFIVRTKALATKTTDTYYNQFDKYTKFEFSSNNLHLRGLTYSYGMDLSENANIERKIIFENKENYKTYIKELGSITDGNYEAILPENDNLSKTRAWYDAKIDLSDIPKGNYIIYITTKSNVTDIYEFTEKLGRSVDEVQKEINGKKYSFKIDYNHGSRVELNVE